MNCPKCFNEKSTKDGFVKEVQRYKCSSCKYKYTVEIKSTAKPKSMKKQALQLYLEGLGFRSIGRFLGVSNVSVLNWIRSFGENIVSLKNDATDIRMVELDEMHSYIGSKKTIVGSGLLLIEMGRDSLISLLAIEVPKQQKSYGKKSNITK